VQKAGGTNISKFGASKLYYWSMFNIENSSYVIAEQHFVNNVINLDNATFGQKNISKEAHCEFRC
jgi:hypothetical protein